MYSPRQTNRSTLIVLMLGLVCSVALFVNEVHKEKLTRNQLFAAKADQYFTHISTGMGQALHTSLIVSQAFDTFGELSKEQFDTFATPLMAQYPYLVGMGYHRLARNAKQQQIEPDHAAILPGDHSDEIRRHIQMVDFAEPDHSVGINAGFQPSGGDAPARAATTGKPAASAVFPLFQLKGVPGFRILFPIYRVSHRAASRDSSAAVSGFTSALFRADLLFQHMLRPSALLSGSGVGISVYSGANASAGALLYQSPGLAAMSRPHPQCWLGCAPAIVTHNYKWAGKLWHVRLVELPDDGTYYGGALALLSASLLLTIAATLYVQSQQSHTRRIQSLVEARTEELHSLNTILLDDIAARKQVLEELSRSQRELRELAEHNARVKEDERKRIAREIHDDLGQSMLALRIDLALIAKDEPNPFTCDRIKHVLTQIDTTMGAMRTIINDLRPSVLDLGIDAAIEWEVAKFHRRTGIECQLDIRSPDLWLSDNVATALYRIVQESMTNIMRHARATMVEVAMWTENGWVFLTLFDNGVGISEQCRRKSKSFGLIGIAERIYALGGAFDTESKPGQGTRLTIAVPYAPHKVIDAVAYADGQQ